MSPALPERLEAAGGHVTQIERGRSQAAHRAGAAEERAKQEAVARVLHEQQLRANAEEDVKVRVAAELKARQQAELEADARYRAEIEQRARAAAAERQKKTEEQVRAEAPAKPAKKPVKWTHVAITGVVVLVAAAVGLLHIIPVTGYIPAAQQLMAQRLGQPVRIGNMRYALLPSPQLTLERVTIGKLQEIKVTTIIVRAGPFALLGDQKDIDSVEASVVTVDEDALASVPAWFNPQSDAQPLQFTKVRLKGIQLGIRAIEMPTLDADVTLARNGALQKAVLSDSKLKIDVSPKDQALQMNLAASDWKPPIGPRIGLDDFTLTAVIDRQRATVTGFEGRLGRGTVKGVAKASWGGDIRVEGEFSLTNGDLGPLLAAFTREFSATGALNTNVTFSLQGNTLATLFAHPRVDASFNIERGVLNNVDIVRAIQASARDGVRGGNTKFDVLAGSLRVANNRYSFQQVRLSSGPMSASGSFDVTPDGDLSGRISAEIGSKSVIVARGTLNVGGNLKAPLLKP